MNLFDILIYAIAMYGALLVAGLVLSYPLKRFFDSKYCTSPQKAYKRIMWFLIAAGVVAFIVEILTRRFAPSRSFDTIPNIVQRHRFRLPFYSTAGRIVRRAALMVEAYPERLYTIFVVLVVIVILYTIGKVKNEAYNEYSKMHHSLLGGLIIISCVLFFNASTIGWLTPSYIAEAPRYTSCGRWSYYMQFMRRHDRRYEPVLVAREVETDNVHKVEFWFSRVDSHDGPDGTWADLTPTDESNTYILTRTSQVGGVYPEYEVILWDYWWRGSTRARLVTLPKPIATGPFMYTCNGRFRYRLEDTYIKSGFNASPVGPAIQLHVQDTETEAEHTFQLFIARDDDIRHGTLHEPIQLEAADAAHLYIVRFANGIDSFYIDLAESTAERTGDSLYSSWRMSEDELIAYRILISGRLNTGEITSLIWYDTYLQMKCVNTNTELVVSERISEVALRRYISNSQTLDWVTIEPRQISQWRSAWEIPEWWYYEGLHEVELRLPCGYPLHPGYNLNLVVDINNGEVLGRRLFWR